MVEQHCKSPSCTALRSTTDTAPMMTEDDRNTETRNKSSHASAAAGGPPSPQADRYHHCSSGQETDSQQQHDTSRSPSKRNKKKEHVKRPMNAFMVWSVTQRKQLSKEQPKLHNTELSKKLGQMWKSLNEDEKQHFKEQADLIKSQHRERYPDYKYRPKRRKVPKLKPQTHECRPLAVSEEGSSTSSDSPRMPLADDLILRTNAHHHQQQISPLNPAAPWYRWEQGYTVSASSSPGHVYQLVQQQQQQQHSSEYPTSSLGYTPASGSMEYCSVGSEGWPPQPTSPNLIDYQHPPPPYQAPPSTTAVSDYHSSPNFQETHASFDGQKPAGTCSPDAYYCDTSVLPPNQMISFEECQCPGQCSIATAAYHFATPYKSEQGVEHLVRVQEFESDLAVAAGPFVDFPVAPNYVHNKPEIRLQTDTVALTSPPTPPISPQVASALHSIPTSAYHNDIHTVMVHCSAPGGGTGLQYSHYS